MVFNTNITSITSNFQFNLNNNQYLIDSTSGNVSGTLPLIVSDGQNFEITRLDNSSNTVSINSSGSNLIYNGLISSSSYIVSPLQNIRIQSFSNGWYISTISSSFTGPTGTAGSSFTGATGNSGQSFTGPTGQSFTGPTGISGSSFTGPTGLSFTGPTGQIGPTGNNFNNYAFSTRTTGVSTPIGTVASAGTGGTVVQLTGFAINNTGWTISSNGVSIPKTGTYDISYGVNISFSSAADTTVSTTLLINSTTAINGAQITIISRANTQTVSSGAIIISLNTGDIITIRALASATSSASVPIATGLFSNSYTAFLKINQIA